MTTLLREIRFTLRQLRKSPGFALTVLLTLAIGITAATVIFSLVDAVLLRPLAFPDSEHLISLETLEQVSPTDSSHGQKGAFVSNDTSYPNFFDWRSLNKSFSGMAAYSTGGLVLGADSNGPARRVDAVQVSSGFFTTLGVAPILGHDFTHSDELPGSRSVVLSHSTWQNDFASDPRIVGKAIVLNEMNFTVIGVMPPGFAFPVSNLDTAFWINDSRDGEGKNPSMQQRGYNQLSVVGRLRPGVTVAQAKDRECGTPLRDRSPRAIPMTTPKRPRLASCRSWRRSWRTFRRLSASSLRRSPACFSSSARISPA